jgi:hypothetical protein
LPAAYDKILTDHASPVPSTLPVRAMPNLLFLKRISNIFLGASNSPYLVVENSQCLANFVHYSVVSQESIPVESRVLDQDLGHLIIEITGYLDHL